MLWSSPRLFKRLAALREAGVTPTFAPGTVVARGFADLGYEEFLVLPGERLLSLMSGSVAPIGEGEQGHFIAAPLVDEASDALAVRGFAVEDISNPDQRSWIIRFAHSSGERHVASGESLRDAFIEALTMAHRRV